MIHRNRQLHFRSKAKYVFWIGILSVGLGLTTSTASASVISSSQSDSTEPDVIILTNGAQLNGQFVRAVGKTVTFHDAVLGDVQLEWKAIKEIRTSSKVAVVRTGMKPGKKTQTAEIPSGILAMTNQAITLTPENQGTTTNIPVAEIEYIVDQATMEKQLRGEPGLLTAWNGAVTAGASLIRAAQTAHNVDGALSLVRSVPTVSWLAPRNRTSLLLTGASGKITQPAYQSTSGPVAEQLTKTDVYQARLQRDQYFSPRMYYFGVTQFDHNFSQNLQLQQLYGAGLGWTVIKLPKQTLDLTANIQYVKQTFIESQPGDNKNLVGSTISANYVANVADGVTFTQYVAYLPAFNNGSAYSVFSRNTLTLPGYKGFRIALGTIDSYLNSVAVSEPPSKRNSFQFTFGLSYDIKSSY